MSNLVIGYADGGSRGNPGPAGYGGVLQKDGETIATVSGAIGIETNNVAEYTGLIKVLEKALEMGFTQIEMRMDSELIVRQITGQYKVKNEGLIPLFHKACKLADKFMIFKIVHVRRADNAEADKLANEAMDLAAKES
jgi:ribonuclease HI